MKKLKTRKFLALQALVWAPFRFLPFIRGTTLSLPFVRGVPFSFLPFVRGGEEG
jgi:hypothetical protein